MKRIIINTKDGPIELEDDDEQTTEEMIKFLMDMMQSNTLAIVKTPHASALVRPSCISGIVIQDNINLPTNEDTSIEQPEINNEELEQNVEIVKKVDVVTDMEE
ncbi:MAG: hypothetical protein KGD64_04035 [Candidatus Heimdallarchaeota archaeon]|nr:hypothetical protein [Candidatus Heimdallarchaeota archaeon]